MQNNIKDVIRTAGDPEYQPLLDELIDLRKRLFCYRLIHYNDSILNVKLNVKGRSAELTNPLIRLFRNSPLALKRILETLSNVQLFGKGFSAVNTRPIGVAQLYGKRQHRIHKRKYYEEEFKYCMRNLLPYV